MAQRTAAMKNRPLTLTVDLSDIAAVFTSLDIPLTEENVRLAARSVELKASAFASAILQDETRDGWLEAIDNLK